MPRQSSIWRRKQDGYYYTTIKRKKLRLSEDKAEARQLLAKLLAQAAEEADNEPKAVGVFPTFRKLADLFLDNSQRVNKPTTYRMHRMYLQGFCDHIGRKRVSDLKVHHVTEWLATRNWGETTHCSARTAILACLNWSVNEGYIHGHPLTKLKRGTHRRRQHSFTADEMRRIRAFTNPQFADFLLGLELTGARPFSELAKVTADMVDWETNTVTLGEHKNVRKGSTRTLYLVPEMVTLLRRLALKHPEGPLFRNCVGGTWTSHDATRRLHYCTERLGIGRGTIYSVRHAFINSALERGLSANVIGELCGNSPITIARHYDSLNKRRSAMLEAAQRAVGG